MKKLIVFESLVMCLLMLLTPCSSAIEVQLSNKTDIMKSSNLNNDYVKSNEKSKIVEKKSTHVIVPGDGDKKYYAIIAGCTEYETTRYNLPKYQKPFPESTMKYVYNVLLNTSNWEKENIVLLLNEKATKKNILDSLINISNIIDGDDVFFFSWTGHGTQVDDIDGDDGDGKDEAICPYDTKDEGGVLLNIIIDDELDSYFSMIAAEGLFIMFESCESGGLVNLESEQNYSFVDVNEDRRVVVMSTLPDKLGFGMLDIGWPMLMLYGLAFSNKSCDIDHNGWISAEEAFMYVNQTYSSFEHDYFVDQINDEILKEAILDFIRMNRFLKKFDVKPGIRFVISTLYAYFYYLLYQTDWFIELNLKILKNFMIMIGAENNPNICDRYFGDLNIIKI